MWNVAPRELKGYLAMIGVLVAWGSSYSISKIALAFMSPLVLSLFRFLTGAVFFSAAGRGLLWSRDAVINALLNGALFVVLINIAIELSKNPAFVSILVYTQPIFVILLSAVVYREPPKPLQIVGTALAFSGLLIAVGASSFDLGDAVAILGAFIWALGTHFYRRRLLRADLLRLNATMGLVSAAIISPVVVVDPHIEPSLQALAWGIGTSLISQIVGFLLWFVGVRELGPVKASSISILVPVSAFLFAFLLLGEIPTWSEIAGSAVALLGVMLAQLASMI